LYSTQCRLLLLLLLPPPPPPPPPPADVWTATAHRCRVIYDWLGIFEAADT
jgi:hypothetical protein